MRENDTEFSIDDKVLEINARANATEGIQIPVNEVFNTYFVQFCPVE